jgi:signal peptidase II
LFAVIVIALDRLTKLLVVRNIELNDGSVRVIPGLFSITHVENRGAAFGLFNDSPTQAKLYLLVAVSTIAMLAIGALLWRAGTALSASTVGLALILGGACGNLWDRLVHHKVTDFLHVYVGNWSWPDFNVADSAIVIGAALLIFEIVFPGKAANEERTA